MITMAMAAQTISKVLSMLGWALPQELPWVVDAGVDGTVVGAVVDFTVVGCVEGVGSFK